MTASEFDTIYIGNFDTYYGGIYDFEIIIHTNGDDDSSNDTLNVSKVLQPSLELNVSNDTSFCGGTSSNIQLNASYPTGYNGNGIVWVSDLSDQAKLQDQGNIAYIIQIVSAILYLYSFFV